MHESEAKPNHRADHNWKEGTNIELNEDLHNKLNCDDNSIKWDCCCRQQENWFCILLQTALGGSGESQCVLGESRLTKSKPKTSDLPVITVGMEAESMIVCGATDCLLFQDKKRVIWD